MTTSFTVERHALGNTHWASSDGAAALTDGEARLAIDCFALTSNNVTYAACGDAMNYWGIFPTCDNATGCIPVWGFADVVESRCEGVSVGERFYGYFPLASDVVLQPTRSGTAGFFDGAEHRRELHAVYNQYLRCSADAGYSQAREAEQAPLRPLFTTSFLIDDFLTDNAFFGARSIVLSSASSKTAYGTAFCLAQRRGTDSSAKVIGLTSAGNPAFARGLGCYDEVLAYGEIDTLSDGAAAVYVDFSGSAAIRTDVHRHFAEGLAYSCSVVARTGMNWAPAEDCPDPGRRCSSRRRRSRSAMPIGVLPACRQGSAGPGLRSCSA